MQDDGVLLTPSRESGRASSASGPCGSGSGSRAGSGGRRSSGAQAAQAKQRAKAPAAAAGVGTCVYDKKEQAALKLSPPAAATKLRAQSVKEFAAEASLSKALASAAKVEKDAGPPEPGPGPEARGGDDLVPRCDPSLDVLRHRVKIAKMFLSKDSDRLKDKEFKKEAMELLMDDPYFKDMEDPSITSDILMSLGQLTNFREIRSKLLPTSAVVVEKFRNHASCLRLLSAVARSILCEVDSWRSTVAAERKAVADEQKAREKEDKKTKLEEEKRLKKERDSSRLRVCWGWSGFMFS